MMNNVEALMDKRLFATTTTEGKYQISYGSGESWEVCDQEMNTIFNSGKDIRNCYDEVVTEVELDSYFSARNWFESEAEECGLRNFWEHEDDFNEWVSENVEFVPENKVSGEVLFSLYVDMGDANYEYSKNNFQNVEDNDEFSSALWLTNQQGYSQSQLSAAINNEIYLDSKYLETAAEELHNSTSSLGKLGFFVRMNLDEAVDFAEKVFTAQLDPDAYTPEKRGGEGFVVLPKDSNCGIIDSVYGGGSLLGIQLEKEVKIPLKNLMLETDYNPSGYGVGQIYGRDQDLWHELSSLDIKKLFQE